MSDSRGTSERRRKQFKGQGNTFDEALQQARMQIWKKCNFPPDSPQYYNVFSIRGQMGDGWQSQGIEVTIEMEKHFEDE